MIPPMNPPVDLAAIRRRERIGCCWVLVLVLVLVALLLFL